VAEIREGLEGNLQTALNAKVGNIDSRGSIR
jgi:hypothetical protein